MLQQRLQIIEFYYQNACSVKKVHCALLPFYGQFNRPHEAIIRAIVTKFHTKFTFLNIKPPTRLRRVRSVQSITALSASVNDDHQISIRLRCNDIEGRPVNWPPRLCDLTPLDYFLWGYVQACLCRYARFNLRIGRQH